MKIWILGAEGMLGSTLFTLCTKRSLSAVGTSHKQADITDLSSLLKTGREIAPTHVINCAAYTNVDGAEKQQEEARKINSDGAGYVACVAKELGARLVHLSTDYVFDGRGATPYREVDFCAPINTYGYTKWEGEKKVLEVLPSACILRISWLFGAKGKNFISSVLKWMREKEEISVVMDQIGKATFVIDAAHAALALLHAEGIFHFANAEEKSRYQIALDLWLAAKIRGLTLKCERIIPSFSAQFPTPAQRPAYSVLDTEKYTAFTQIRPRTWHEVINDFLDYELSL